MKSRWFARYVPVTFPTKRCCATGCGDKIKDDRMIEVKSATTGEIFYLEEGCIEWFEDGHPDYGFPRGLLIWESNE